jgi:8-oxo-dGTP pyrophosphatase MutT (NUDIX family)
MSIEDWPQYACAILEDGSGRLLLESRPHDARLAAGKLTCFGGRRHDGEAPEECLLRELREELNWEPRTLEKCVELRVGGELIAWFYRGTLDVEVERLVVAPGHRALLVPREQLTGVPLSLWHAAVLEAWIAGRTGVQLNS